MKILFVYTTSRTDMPSSPKPLTFQILAALTPQKHSVEIAEGEPQDINFDKKYDLIGITCTTPYAFSAYEIAKEFKRRGSSVILGGWHPSALPEEAKQHADSIVIGEAEEIWPQLLKDFENGRLKPFYIPEHPVDPKMIPHPRNIYPEEMDYPIQATRGCPIGCEFCAITNMKFRNIFRTRPIKDVIEEVQSLSEKEFTFHDNSLTINPNYTKRLFNELKELDKKFHGFGNVNVLGRDDEFLELASEAGCIGWYVGFESISQDSLDNIGKKTNRVKEYKPAIKKIHDYGMMIVGSFMFGFDENTLDIFDNTNDFVKESGIDVPHPHILVPNPGTPIYDRLEKEGRILTKDWSKYKGEHVIFQPKHMTPEDLLTNTVRMHREWYKTSRCIKRIIRTVKLGFYPFRRTISENLRTKFSWFQ